MSETQSDGLVENAMGLTGAEAGSDSGDKDLHAIWEKHNGPEAELKNPAMPASLAAAEGDHFKAAWDWNQLPLKERRETAAVHRDFADLKKQGEALGMKTETAADMRAIQEMLNGDKGRAAPPAIDRDTQASLDTFKAVVPFAKDHKEASQFLNGWAETIARDPDKGWSELLKAQGMGHLLRDSAAPPNAPLETKDNSVAPYLQQWASKSGATNQDMAEMADIMSDPSWREIAGESDKSALDRAYKALQRRGTSKQARQGRQMDADLRGLAADIYRD